MWGERQCLCTVPWKRLLDHGKWSFAVQYLLREDTDILCNIFTIYPVYIYHSLLSDNQHFVFYTNCPADKIVFSYLQLGSTGRGLVLISNVFMVCCQHQSGVSKTSSRVNKHLAVLCK